MYFYFLFLAARPARTLALEALGHSDACVSVGSKICAITSTIVGIEPIRFQLDPHTGKHRFAPRDTIHF